jgi:membrane dipeptidase
MNRVGVVVDVSHTGHRTAMDVVEVSTHPVIFSHSGCAALLDHGRNISDEQIRACAKTGGVVGLVGVGFFMSRAGRDISAAAIVRHIEHIADKRGSYDMTEMHSAGPSVIPEIAETLLQKSYPEEAVRGILGGNWLRVFEAVIG